MRALTAKVRGSRFNPGWLPVFHGSLKIFLSLFIMYMYVHVPYIYINNIIVILIRVVL